MSDHRPEDHVAQLHSTRLAPVESNPPPRTNRRPLLVPVLLAGIAILAALILLRPTPGTLDFSAPTPEPSLHPAPTTPFALFIPPAATVAEAQKRAIAQYPDLAVPSSPLHQRFLLLVKSYQATNPERFRDPTWPLKVAAEAAGHH